MPRRLAIDRSIALTVGLLFLGGLFMVGSASHYQAILSGRSPYGFLFRHLVHGTLGGLGLVAAMSIPYRKLSSRTVIVVSLCVSFAALLAVMAMPASGGAHRWFRFGPLTVQPSEYIKIIAILFTAELLSRRESEIETTRAVALPAGAVVGGLAVLTALEPDLGSAVMMVVPSAVLIFVAGLRWRAIGALAGAGLLGFIAAVIAEPYRIQRIRTFLDPAADPRSSGFQLAQSLLAVGSGGIFGVGLGQGRQQAFFLPAAHTDFIFSVAGEELGMIGALLLLAAFLVLFWRGTRAALRAPDRFGFYVALGLTSLLVLQGLIHMGVCLGLLPTKGLPLPFVSYGGSSLVASMIAVGLLLNVSQHSG